MTAWNDRKEIHQAWLDVKREAQILLRQIPPQKYILGQLHYFVSVEGTKRWVTGLWFANNKMNCDKPHPNWKDL